MVNRVVVGAGYGFKDWLLQRITAVVMAVYSIVLAVVLLAGGPLTLARWHDIFACGPMKVATFVFALSLFYHAWVGIRDLWMDYIKCPGQRLTLHTLTAVALIAYAVWTALILWRL